MIKRILILMSFLILVSSALLFSAYYGMNLAREGRVSTLSGIIHELTKDGIQPKIGLVSRYFQGFQAKPKRIDIHIKLKNFQKLAQKRTVAIQKKYLIATEDDYVPATIIYEDKKTKVKLRLKGDYSDHFLSVGDKWSFRIKVKGKKTLFGMKQFSIHHPRTRNFINEWLFHQLLKKEDVLSLRYYFIDVNLNGKNLGIYALEEHFEKRLLEHNNRREGPIIRFNEGLMWDEKFQQERFNGTLNGTGDYLSSDIDAFHTSNLISNPAGYKLHNKAISLLEAFRRGKLNTGKVFDTGKLAKFFAITDLMGATHGATWHNFRFYYNPITSKLEPIGFDGNGGHNILGPINSILGIFLKGNTKTNGEWGNNPPVVFSNYFSMIFNDMNFFREYLKTLDRISNPDYLKNFFKDIKHDLEENLKILNKEFFYTSFSKDLFWKNQEYIRTVLNPVKGVHAYFYKAYEDHIELQLGNLHSLPIEIKSVTYKNTVLKPKKKILLPAKVKSELVDYFYSSFFFPNNFEPNNNLSQELEVRYSIPGLNKFKSVKVFPWPYLEVNFLKNDFIRQKQNIKQFPFLIVNENNKTIYIKPGIWNIDRNLIIPGGYTVLGGEGVQLILSKSAKILSYSPFELVGSPKKPVRIRSKDNSGQGLFIVKTERPSFFEYVNFENLSAPQEGGWKLSGAVTFYEASVTLKNCQFIKSRSEDSLNIIRSEFEIQNSRFNQSDSDAIDFDFSKGSIINTTIENSGNDAIDISGSEILLKNININIAGDKGISAGEKSKVEVKNIRIQNVKTGIASKDLSLLFGHDINIIDSNVGLSAFQKKPEYGPAVLQIDGLSLKKVNTSYSIEEKSSLILNGKRIDEKNE